MEGGNRIGGASGLKFIWKFFPSQNNQGLAPNSNSAKVKRRNGPLNQNTL